MPKVALDDLKRMGAVGVIAAMQGTHATSDMYWAEERVGTLARELRSVGSDGSD